MPFHDTVVLCVCDGDDVCVCDVCVCVMCICGYHLKAVSISHFHVHGMPQCGTPNSKRAKG